MNDHSHTEGATPGDDISGLIRSRLTDRRSRDIAELEAISNAYNKRLYRARRKTPGSDWLTDAFIRQVHRDMFGSIWKWAGKYRTTDKNIGVKPHLILEQIGQLCSDFKFWDSPGSRMEIVEIAARLQSTLTRIHPFENGNGRHARLITDILFYSRKHSLPKWPQLQLMPQGDQIRKNYISAMKNADQGDFKDLAAFIQDCLAEESSGS